MMNNWLNHFYFELRNEDFETTVLPEKLAEGIANEIISIMPEDSNITLFIGKALNEIAEKMVVESEKVSLKIPTSQELIAYTGEYSGENHFGINFGASKEDIIKKLVNSRFDLSDFADITYNEEHKNEVDTIVIAAAHKGKILHIGIGASENGFEKILKKCTLH